jgi:hypothetical protein
MSMKKVFLSVLREIGVLRADAVDPTLTAFFARELESIRAKSYDTKLQPLKARQFLPIDNSVDPGAQIVTYRAFTPTGTAKLIGDYADDLPRADVYGKEFTSVVRSIGASYGFSVDELLASAYANKGLDVKKANAARRNIEEKLDTIGALGDTQNRILGFLNQPNTTSFSVPNGASLHSDFARKTPDEILADLFGITNGIVSSTKEVEKPDTLLLPPTQYHDIATRRVSSLADTSVLDYFMKKSPYIKVVDQWARLSGAGVGNVDRMVAYRKDPDAIQFVISQEFMQLPPQAKGLEYVTPCKLRTGGVIVPYPLSISYGDGI